MPRLDLTAELDGVLVVASSGKDPDLAPFIGRARLGESLLVVRAGREPVLGYLSPMERDEAARSGLKLLDPELLEVRRASDETSSDSEVLAWVLGRALLAAGLSPGTVALAGRAASGRVYAACRQLEEEGWSFTDGHQLLRRARKRKSENEIEAIREAAAGTVDAFRAVARMLTDAVVDDDEDGRLWLAGAPLTVARVKAEIARTLAATGLQQPEGGIVAPAEEGAVPHTSGTADRVLCSGESLVIDIFPKGLLFADCTRTFCVGPPSDACAKAHATTREALLWAIEATRPAVTGWSLQQGVCERLEAAGYPTPISDPGTQRGYVHGLGHGVGYELHELPTFREREDGTGTLEVGDVVTLEPGLYDEAAGYGVRIEDLVVVTEGGIENLTPMPYDLEPGAYLD